MSKLSVIYKSGICAAIAALGLGMTSHAKAMNLSIGVDLDSSTAGIQDFRFIDPNTVDLNSDSISVDIVLTNDTDSSIQFTNVDLELFYNNRFQTVLTPGAAPQLINSGSTFNSIATGTPAIIDNVSNSIGFTGANPTLATQTPTNAPLSGFTGSIGRVAFNNIGSLFNVAAGESEVLFTATLDYNGIEGSTLLNVAGLFGGVPNEVGQGTAIFNRTAGSAALPSLAYQESELVIGGGPQGGGGITPVPEPTTVLGSGLVILLGAFGRRRYRRGQ